MELERKVIIIAGPNGAEKQPLRASFYRNETACPVFVNAV